MIVVFAIADVSAYNVADILHLHESDSGVDIVHGIFIADLLDVIFKPRTFLVKAEPTEPAGTVEFRFRLHGQESAVYCGQPVMTLSYLDPRACAASSMNGIPVSL